MQAHQLLARSFCDAHPADVARVLERLGPLEAAPFLAQVSGEAAAAVLQHMTALAAAECLARLPVEPLSAIAMALPFELLARLLRRLEPAQQEALLDALAPDTTQLLRRVLRFPDHTAGALMDPRVFAFPEEITVAEALTRLRRSPGYVLSYLYVVDPAQRLIGVLAMRDAMTARPKDLLRTLMHRDVQRIAASATTSAVLSHPGWQQFHALPVVDDQGVFLGALRYRTWRELDAMAATRQARWDPLGATLTISEWYWQTVAALVDVVTDAMRTPAMRANNRKAL